MIDTCLCYIEYDGKYLMLLRNKKTNDLNEGKWIGVGGKLENGETPDGAMLRELREETGIELSSYHFHGVIHFRSDKYEAEEMYLYSAELDCLPVLSDCSEGELAWIEKERLFDLPLWEGDKLFLKKLLDGDDRIEMLLRYEGDTLAEWEDLS